MSEKMLSDTKNECAHIKNADLERMVHKTKGTEFFCMCSVQDPNMSNTNHACQEKLIIQDSVFQRGQIEVELLAKFAWGREEWGFLSKL